VVVRCCFVGEWSWRFWSSDFCEELPEVEGLEATVSGNVSLVIFRFTGFVLLCSCVRVESV
jgi:hypothetical protein